MSTMFLWIVECQILLHPSNRKFMLYQFEFTQNVSPPPTPPVGHSKRTPLRGIGAPLHNGCVGVWCSRPCRRFRHCPVPRGYRGGALGCIGGVWRLVFPLYRNQGMGCMGCMGCIIWTDLNGKLRKLLPTVNLKSNHGVHWGASGVYGGRVYACNQGMGCMGCMGCIIWTDLDGKLRDRGCELYRPTLQLR